MPPAIRAPVLALLAAVLVSGGDLVAQAQLVVPDQGVVGSGLRMRQLDGIKRVLLVGAHPDDEDTSLITALARREGAEVAYLSLSRGEGGQNLIGPELDEGLGIVRTGELLAARELDGGRQFFSRAFDFGFSKSAEETFGYWPREEVLADAVWIARKFRPQVVVSIFPPDARAGHGQHEVAGIVAHAVFEVAGDPERFPEQLRGADAVEPWSPDKLYRSARFDREESTLEIPTGSIDPLLGRSYHQLAMESRSQHRSQDMGAAQGLGPRSTHLTLVETRVSPGGADDGIFAGVDTALVSVAESLPTGRRAEVRSAIERYRDLIHEVTRRARAFEPWETASILGRAVEAVAEAVAASGTGPEGDDARRALEQKSSLAREAFLAASGIVVDVRVGDGLVVPGESLDVDVRVWNGGPFSIERADPRLRLPAGWSSEAVTEASAPRGGGRFDGSGFGDDQTELSVGASSVEPESLARWTFRVRVPEDADLSRLYYLERELDGEMYRWPDARSLWGMPRNPPAVVGEVALRVSSRAAGSASGSDGDGGGDGAGRGNGTPVVDAGVTRPADYVGVDDAMGEFREPLLVVPAISVLTRPGIMAWPLDEREPRPVTVAVRNQSEAGFEGHLVLDVPEGWVVEPDRVALTLGDPGEERSVTFRVTPGAEAEEGMHRLRAVAESDDGHRFDQGFEMVDYPHVDRNVLFRDATTRVSMFPVRADEGLRVGYVMGSGDGGAEALSQIGIDVTLLGADAVRDGSFDAFDVIVLGVRAYETRPDLVGANGQLLDWVRRGGRLLVQYNRYEFSGAGYAPFPVSIDRPHDRVTDETAPVALLDPGSPVFEGPNRIGARDFEGWAQERGLYFLHDWDERYTPLLEMADPGEDPVRGSLLVAPVGNGLWIYTGLAFFRQFPEGVPGAYRLLANLVSLEPEEWRAHHGSPGGGGAR